MTIIIAFLLNFSQTRISRFLKYINHTLEEGINGGLAHIIDMNFEGARLGDIRRLADNLNAMLQELKSVFWVIKENLLETKINNSTLENMKLIMISYIQKVTNIGNVRMELEVICKKINAATSSTKGILDLIVDLANKTTKEAAAIMQSSDAIEKLLDIITRIITITQDKQRLATALKAITYAGGKRIKKTSSVIQQLNANTDEMMKIIQIINDITETTNILSINASIEAAHTGQEGRGFRVIADEIKKLVASSKKNANEISILLNDQVKNISLALRESSSSGDIFGKVSAEVEDVAKTWVDISDNTQEMSNRANVIKDATARMIEITDEVLHSSTSIKQSVEKITKENKELDETSSRTLDIIERVTITNEEAKKSTLDILQQLNDMGTFVKKLNTSIDFFNLGKKIFLFTSDTTLSRELIKTILHDEYEIYPVIEYKKLLQYLKESANTILLIAFDSFTSPDPVFELITTLYKSPELKKIQVGVFTIKKDSSLIKLEKKGLCTILPQDDKEQQENISVIMQYIKKNRARGLRKNIRVNCSLKDNVILRFYQNKQICKGGVINLSSSAALADFSESIRPIGGNARLKITLIINNQEIYLTSHSLVHKENTLYIINFECSTENRNREKLFEFIYQKLQANLKK